MKLKDKVALITGSARGLGWEIAQAYADEGAHVTICDLVAGDLDQAVAKLQISEDRALGVKADITREKEVTDLFEIVRRKFGRIDIVVNNAGFAWPRGGPVNLTLADTPLDVWQKILDTNLTGTFLCSREALRIMRPQYGGSIINISSPQGKRG